MQRECFHTDLAITQSLDAIRQALEQHPVIIVCGATGSGKTTQLPKLCFQLRDHLPGMIGHTQPRRLAAKRVAQRLAQEWDVTLGECVGLQTRFEQRQGANTRIKVMTEGILLNALKSDPQLRQYHTLILDEVHERSLNVDFLMGYLKKQMPNRPDLKVILTSASLAAGPMSTFFHNAPIINIVGRTFPVTIEHRSPLQEGPLGSDRDPFLKQLIDSVESLDRSSRPEDILIFLTGEPEIAFVKPRLQEHFPDSLILPLYARQTPTQQNLIFQPSPRRKLVLSTNVAETSLTVPSIRHVIDSGRARISRYLPKSRIASLRIEPICQASAIQRAGRCGRTAPGTCIRLYDAADYASRPPFLEPEIQRTHLGALLLRMGDLKLGSPKHFDFLDKPDHRRLQDAMTLLKLLGAVEPQATLWDPITLTAYGRQLAKLPLDPTLGALFLEGLKQGIGYETAVLAALLSIEDPCLWPKDEKQKVKTLRGPWYHPRSDFITYLRFWSILQTEQRQQTRKGFEQFCHQYFFHPHLVRQWQLTVEQLLDARAELRADVKMLTSDWDSPALETRLNRCLMRALFWGLAIWDRQKKRYRGGVGGHFELHPKSVLWKKHPAYILSALRLQTDKAWACMAAAIDPQDIAVNLPEHLAWRYGDPYWDEEAQGVFAMANASIFGLPIISQRRCYYPTVDPNDAKKLWIWHTFLDEQWENRAPFLLANRSWIAELTRISQKLRHERWLLSQEEQLHLYLKQLPETVIDRPTFEKWYRKTPGVDQILRFETDPGLAKAMAQARETASAYPDAWRFSNGHTAKVTYQFEPGGLQDGITLDFSSEAELAVIGPELTWHLPIYREALAIQLLSALPKKLRCALSTGLTTIAQTFVSDAHASTPHLSITQALTRFLLKHWKIVVPSELWAWDAIEPYLQVHCTCNEVTRAAHEWCERLAATTQTLATQPLPARQMQADDMQIRTTTQLQSLAEKGWSVSTSKRIEPFATTIAPSNHCDFPASFKRQWKKAWPQLSLQRQAQVRNFLGLAKDQEWLESLDAQCSMGLLAHSKPHWFAPLTKPLSPFAYWDWILRGTEAYRLLQESLGQWIAQGRYPVIIEATQQWLHQRLQRPNFFVQTPWLYLQHYPRYLEALTVRLVDHLRFPEREIRFNDFCRGVESTLKFLQREIGPTHPNFRLAQEANWCFEEYHVQQFAQRMRTACTISAVRLQKILTYVLEH